MSENNQKQQESKSRKHNSIMIAFRSIGFEIHSYENRNCEISETRSF